MAFYEQEIAKLNRKMDILADKAGVVFADESDDDLTAHQSIHDAFNEPAKVDRTPQPNTIPPALPNIVIDPGPNVSPSLGMSASEAVATDPQTYAEAPIDAAVQPVDETPAETTPVHADKEGDSSDSEGTRD